MLLDDKFMKSMERLTALDKEYKEKVEFYKRMNDDKNVLYYQGACEGITVAISALAPYLTE